MEENTGGLAQVGKQNETPNQNQDLNGMQYYVNQRGNR